MRIMYCLPEMSHPGGIARVESIKANWLVNNGHEVYIVTTDQCGDCLFCQLDNRILHRDLCIDFRSYENENHIKKYYLRRKKISQFERQLKAIVDEWKPDIIVSTFNNESEFLYKWHDGSKKVLEYHFCHAMTDKIIEYGKVSFVKSIALKLKLRRMESLAKKYDAFVVLTNEDAKDWKGYDNLCVIPNMLSFETDETSDCTAKRVIAVGRLDFQKKFDRLIEIWTEIHEDFRDWHLDIFGQGNDYNKLISMINDNRLEDYVTIHRPTSNIKKEYLNSSIMAMTSTYEGLPMSLLEACSCGLPCIAYNYKCGPNDVINDGETGFVVEEDDKISFKKKLVELMDNKELRIYIGTNAKLISRDYSVERIMLRWLELFNTIILK